MGCCQSAEGVQKPHKKKEKKKKKKVKKVDCSHSSYDYISVGTSYSGSDLVSVLEMSDVKSILSDMENNNNHQNNDSDQLPVIIQQTVVNQDVTIN